MSSESVTMESKAYAALGVSSTKTEVHQALEKTYSKAKELYPGAFCQLWPDVFGKEEAYCYLLHADGVGTKAALAYIYWRETGDLSVWRDIAQDALVMNTDDALCVGANQGPFLFSSSIARHTRYIPAEVLSALIEGTEAYIQQLRDWGFDAILCGGETADVGDMVHTVTVDATLMLRMRRDEVIDNSHMRAGDVIVGLASFGDTSYDRRYNSGIGSNGLTLARHVLLDKVYGERYPESCDQNNLSEGLAYRGKYKLEDTLPDTPPNMQLSIGKALLSPTRSYLPFMRDVLDTYRDKIHGLVHCTGSGHTKLWQHFGFLSERKDTLHVIKDRVFDPPPLFKCIQEAAQLSCKEMYRVFNMGQRLEIYTDEQTAEDIIKEAHKIGLQAQQIGYVAPAPADAPKGKLSVHRPEGVLEYVA